MKEIQKLISPFIRQQFPSLYQEEGDRFITFVEEYYKWLEGNYQEIILEDTADFNIGDTIEQDGITGTIVNTYDDGFFLIQIDSENRFKCTTKCASLEPVTSSSGGETFILLERSYNPLFHSRNLADYRDIDNTVEQFIGQFKAKYLPDIEFTTATNKELFIKNSLDFYRAKGTERAVDLYFKLVHGFAARVYYPGDDLIKASDNKWDEQYFLEVLDKPNVNPKFEEQQIVGSISGSTAYVERFTRYKIGARYISILYLDNVEGDFLTGEQVYTTTRDAGDNVTNRIEGSVTTVDVLSSDSGFSIGDDLSAIDGSGTDLKVRVTGVETKTGIVSFDFIDFGWGYTSNAVVLASNSIIRTANLSFTNTHYFSQNYFIRPFDTLRQDLLTIDLEGGGDVADFSTLLNSATVYDGANVQFTGTIVAYVAGTGNNATITVNYDSTTYTENDANGVIWTQGNTASANTGNTANVSASANVIGEEYTFTIEYDANTNPQITLARGDVLEQIINTGSVDEPFANVIVEKVFERDDKYYANVKMNKGAMRSDINFSRKSDDTEFFLRAVSNAHFGVITPTNTFYNGANTYTDRTGTFFTFDRQFGYSVEAVITIPTDLTEEETILDLWNDTYIDRIDANTLLNVTTMDVWYAGNTSVEKTLTGGMANTVDSLPEGFANVTVGELTGLVVNNPGDGYARNPMYRVWEPKFYNQDHYDYEFEYLSYSGANTLSNPITLSEGELVTANNGAKARITYYDRTDNRFYANRLSTIDFVPGLDIYTQQSNRTLLLNNLWETRRGTEQLQQYYSLSGFNAEIFAEALNGTGFITSVDIVDTGYGYLDGEQVQFALGDLGMISNVFLGNQGKREGYFLTRKGFLSSDKYLHDNDYYQEYSYQVITSLPFDRYVDTLKDILHVAGTKPFGSYFGLGEGEVTITTPINFETTTTGTI